MTKRPRKRAFSHVERVYAGKNGARESLLRLSDASGKARIQLRVTADGEAAIEFLDEEGEVSRQLTPDTLARAR